MFGYVRPLRRELKVKDWESYRSAYCGLCHALQGQCGLSARFVLNYDFLFLALLLEEPGEEAGEPGLRRCPAHPIRGRPCLSATCGMALCAQESVILAYHKLLDDVADEGPWGGLKYRLAALALTPAYRRAKALLEPFDSHVRACLAQLAALEGESSPHLDRVADTFARLLAGCAPPGGDDSLDRPRQQLLYHLGRWIYLADGVDDYQDDAQKGRYNPVLARFGGQPDLDYLATTMTHSLTLAQSAFQLLPRTRWSDILENILYLGLPQIQRLVLAGSWGGKEKQEFDRL